MARLTNEQKGKIVEYALKGDNEAEINTKMKMEGASVGNFLKKIQTQFGGMSEETESPTEVDAGFDPSEMVLTLITEGLTEKNAYYVVYSTLLEDTPDTEAKFISLVDARKRQLNNDENIHNDRAAVMTERTSEIKPKSSSLNVYDMPHIHRNNGS